MSAHRFPDQLFFIAAALIGLSLAPATANAATIVWQGGAGPQSFTEGANWVGGNVPSNVDRPFIDSGDGIVSYAYLDTAATIQRFSIAETTNLTTGGLELRNNGVLTNSQNSISYIGTRGVGYFRMLPGSTMTTVNAISVAYDPNSIGNVAISGGNLTVGTYLQLGRAGTGTAVQTGGTVLLNRATLNGLELGTQATGVGTYEISNGSLSILANLGVGVAGKGEFKVIGDDAIISVGGSYSQSALSTVHFDITDSVSAIDVAGNVALNGTLDVQFSAQPQYGDEFVLMNYGGQLTGAFSTFQTLVDGPLGPGSIEVALNYGSGADSVLSITVVPEPHTALLLGSALLLAATLRHGARHPFSKFRDVA